MLRDRNRALETELAVARSEIEGYRSKEQELNEQIGAALRRANEIEEAAQARAREVIASAEEVSLRARSEAHKRIEDTSDQFNELLRLKENLLETMRGVVSDFDHAVARVERGEQLFPEAQPTAPAPQPAPTVEAPPVVPVQAPPAEAPPAYVEPEPAALSIPALPVSSPEPPPHESPPAAEEQIFETRVELDAGPFSDFASLSAFERSLSHLPRVEDVYVRRLADDRALIELTLSEPSPLLQAMRESLSYSLEVRSASRAKLVVNVFAQSPAGMH